MNLIYLGHSVAQRLALNLTSGDASPTGDAVPIGEDEGIFYETTGVGDSSVVCEELHL